MMARCTILFLLALMIIFAPADCARAAFWEKWTNKPEATVEPAADKKPELAPQNKSAEDPKAQHPVPDVKKPDVTTIDAGIANEPKRVEKYTTADIKPAAQSIAAQPADMQKLSLNSVDKQRLEDLRRTQEQVDRIKRIQEMNTSRSMDNFKRMEEIDKQRKQIEEINKMNKAQRQLSKVPLIVGETKK
ncbi:MAG: hypothetical protein WC487_03855 [Candidatus Omnitrophota bacterium]